MREFFLSTIIKITSGLHSWAHKQKYSKDQKFQSLSSGEAEFYALVKTASQGLGLKAMLADLGITAKLKIIDKN